MQNDNPAYDKLILANGQPQYGRFLQPIQEINIQDFDYQTVMDKPASRWQKYFAFNQFQFLGIHSARFSIGVAIANVRYAASTFIYLFDRSQNEMTEKRWIQPLAWNCSMSHSPHSGASTSRKGKNELCIKRSNAKIHLSARLGEEANMDLTLFPKEVLAPLSVCTRAGYNGWSYTEKTAGLSVGGRLQWRHYNLDLEKDAPLSLGTSDWSCGFMRRETAWNWASGCGQDKEGNTVGLNLAAGVNETAFNENGFWINGKLFPLGNADFRFRRRDRMLPWKVEAENATLEFQPQGQFQDKANALVVASNFSQLPGFFSGTLRDTTGRHYTVEALPGVVEDHFARW